MLIVYEYYALVVGSVLATNAMQYLRGPAFASPVATDPLFNSGYETYPLLKKRRRSLKTGNADDEARRVDSSQSVKAVSTLCLSRDGGKEPVCRDSSDVISTAAHKHATPVVLLLGQQGTRAHLCAVFLPFTPTRYVQTNKLTRNLQLFNPALVVWHWIFALHSLLLQTTQGFLDENFAGIF